MKKLKIKKVIACLSILLLLITSTSIGANAEWRQNSNGWWYTEGNSWSTGWRLIDSKWYYFDNNGYMKTGWVQDSYRWYYLNQNGDMASNTVIDGYTIGSDGAWISNTDKNDNLASNQNDTTKASITSNSNTNNASDSSSSSSSSNKKHHSSSNSSKQDITINNIGDVGKLRSNVKYGKVIVNVVDSEINIKNITADNLVINNADWIYFNNCTIKSIEVNSGKYPKIELEENCKIDNIIFNSTGRVDEDIRHYKNIVNNVYVNTDKFVQIIGIINNVEISKENANVWIGGLESEVKQAIIKEVSSIKILYCNLGKLETQKHSNIEIKRSQINELNSSSGLEINFVENIFSSINNLVNNSTENINIKGYNKIPNINEIKKGSVILDATTNNNANDVIATTSSAITIN